MLLIAIKSARIIVDLTPNGDLDRPGYLYKLALLLLEGYRRLGDLKDLEAAVRTAQAAVDSAPEAHPNYVRYVRHLAVCLHYRHLRLGDLYDLQAVLKYYQKALDLTSEGHCNRVLLLHGMGMSLRSKYLTLGHVQDLQSSLRIIQEVVELTTAQDPSRAFYLDSLGILFSDQHQLYGNPTHLDMAVQTSQEVLDLTPHGHSERPARLGQLTQGLLDRYLKLNHLSDLEDALKKGQEAVQITVDGDPRKPILLQILANCFSARYKRLRGPLDLEAVNSYYKKSFTLPTMWPERAWQSSFHWASFLAAYQPSYCTVAYKAGFSLLPQILWIGHPIEVRHAAIRWLNIKAAIAQATRISIEISNLTSAIELLEQGLATTFQQTMQLQTDVHGILPDQAHDLQRLSKERKDLLEKIRRQRGLEYFLLPRPYPILQHASEGGPIIVLNSSPRGCDAILILCADDDPVHVPLPHRESFHLKSTEESFADILTWLWENVVSPVYQALGSHDIRHGRLWWLPTGAFTGLPLHAAPPTDKFIHSYTVTLGALRDSSAKKPPRISPKVGIVGVTHTSYGQAQYLPGVRKEVNNIVSIIDKPQVECLVGEQATVNAVKQQLEDCSWVHLACHGKQDLTEPTKSRLLLYQGSLELESILRMPLAHAEFVFLAACQTAMGDSELVNESFHLGGGFIAAGFRSAVGTLWSMNDLDGPLVAEVFYRHLFRDGRKPQASDTAEALHLAVKELKRRKLPYERWIPFIHMGV
ncbi:CHAT domain-containing protein [Mycena leptocephala]|nr:CHAT domain-containing protein [Mycena leptocephala]